MGTVNDRNRKYWIRYVAGQNRLMETFTDGGKRPQGRGWVEIAIDRCCNLPEFPVVDIEYNSTAICTDLTTIETFLIILQGQDSQGTFSYNLTVDTTSTFSIPASLEGNFKAKIVAIHSEDYVHAELFDSLNVLLVPAIETDGSNESSFSNTFDIANLDHIIFTCSPSG